MSNPETQTNPTGHGATRTSQEQRDNAATEDEKSSKVRDIATAAAHVPGQAAHIANATLKAVWAKTRELIEKLNLKHVFNSVMPFIVGAFIGIGGITVAALLFGSLMGPMATWGVGMLLSFVVVRWLVTHTVMSANAIQTGAFRAAV